MFLWIPELAGRVKLLAGEFIPATSALFAKSLERHAKTSKAAEQKAICRIRGQNGPYLQDTQLARPAIPIN
jgi:hypothetical protein